MSKEITFLITVLLLITISPIKAQNNEDDSLLVYRRSSLYTLLINHREKEFAKDIEEVFKDMPFPDKFNNHDLRYKVIDAAIGQKYRGKHRYDARRSDIETFMYNNALGRRMVAKWFNRHKDLGTFDLSLIQERGHYDASFYDIELSKASVRGSAMLADAGEELIGNTFVLFNEIVYVNKEERAKTISSIFSAIGTIAEAYTGTSNNVVSSSAKLGSTISDNIAGFRVKVTSYLFRLDWTDDIAGRFYEELYMDSTSYDEAKKTLFDKEKDLFTLSFVGMQEVDSGNTSIKGINTNKDMIRKVCTRAIDKSIVELQRGNEAFRIKTPIYSVKPEITAKIGMKEGITEKSVFEVLEREVDKTGRIVYKRVGTLKPVKNKIWDNRYMAAEEEAEGSKLTETTFKKASGKDFYPGMLIREIKF